MENQLKFYINGEWVSPIGSETIEVINPSNESVIGTIAAGTKDDIDTAVTAASNAFQSFGFLAKKTELESLKILLLSMKSALRN